MEGHAFGEVYELHDNFLVNWIAHIKLAACQNLEKQQTN